ncbi:hypothetical protein NU195Hw_g2821t1 [Hortaea werneckii]
MTPPPTNAYQAPPIGSFSEPTTMLSEPSSRLVEISEPETQQQVSARTSGALSPLEPPRPTPARPPQAYHQHADQYRALPAPPPIDAPPCFPSNPPGELSPLPSPVGDKLSPDLPPIHANRNIFGSLSLDVGLPSTEENDDGSLDAVDELLIKWTTLPVS